MAITPFPTDTEISTLQTSTYNAGTNIGTGYMYGSGNPALPSPENPAPVSKIQGFLTAVKQLVTWLKSTSPQLTQETWTNVTLLNSWVNLNVTTDNAASYMRDSMGFVCLRGTIRNGTTAANTSLFQLPAGYRPAKASAFMAPSSAGITQIQVLEATHATLPGHVRLLTSMASNTYLFLDSIRFDPRT